MRNVKAAGEVRLLNADIGGNLECDGAELNNPGGKAFSADGLKVKGSVFLKSGFKAAGEVRLPGADIGRNLECDGAEFDNPKVKNSEGYALFADGLMVKGYVFLRNSFKAAGEVRLLGADIGGYLDCTFAEFNNPNGNALNCESASIKGALSLRKLKGFVGALVLMHTTVGQLIDDQTGWPGKGKLYIDGFEYGDLPGDKTPKTATKRIEWLRLQRGFNPRPYEQLAKVFREMGRESDAKEVLIAKQDDLRKSGQIGRLARYWNLFLKITIGHGYKPVNAIAIILWVMLIGAGVFWKAKAMDVMQPSKERVYLDASFKKDGRLPSRYPRFEPMVYSIDTFVPFVNLQQQDYWLPVATKKHGWFFRLYLWFHITAGWVLSTLAAVSLTGLIRKGKE